MALISSSQIHWADSERITVSSTAVGFTANRICPINGTEVDSGTTDGTTANKLVDAGQNFLTTVRPGYVAVNLTDNTETRITAVDSDSQLSVTDDIFTSGESYSIRIKSDYHGQPADFANVKVETDSIRWRQCGSTPTSSIGKLQVNTDDFTVEGSINVKNFKSIRVTSDATLEVHYGWGIKK